ncbi:MAG TPA: response regulator, partial [Polyangia bacterium]
LAGGAPAGGRAPADRGGELAAPPIPQEPSAGTGRRILIVEDGVDAAESLATLLEAYGYSAAIALSARSALEQATLLQPEVVLLDLGLPDMDGYDALERMKDIQGLGSTRFIALSGRGAPEDLARSRAAGFHAHVVKPPYIENLLAIISS